MGFRIGRGLSAGQVCFLSAPLGCGRSASSSASCPCRSAFLRAFSGWLLAVALLVAAIPAVAANRSVSINAPTSVAPGSPVKIVIFASTDAGGGEKIGFFHAEYSLNQGKTW